MIEHRRQKGVFVATDIAAVLLMLRDYYEANSKGNVSGVTPIPGVLPGGYLE